jgi:hypothetical protein
VVLLQPHIQLGGDGPLQLGRYAQLFPQLPGDFHGLRGCVRLVKEMAELFCQGEGTSRIESTVPFANGGGDLVDQGSNWI